MLLILSGLKRRPCTCEWRKPRTPRCCRRWGRPPDWRCRTDKRARGCNPLRRPDSRPRHPQSVAPASSRCKERCCGRARYDRRPRTWPWRKGCCPGWRRGGRESCPWPRPRWVEASGCKGPSLRSRFEGWSRWVRFSWEPESRFRLATCCTGPWSRRGRCRAPSCLSDPSEFSSNCFHGFLKIN